MKARLWRNFYNDINDFGDKIMEKIADALATKTTFVLFCFIAFSTLVIERPHDVLGWQSWVSQTVIQLISLNVLAAVAKIEARRQAAKFEKQFNAILAILDMEKEERTDIKNLVAEIHKNTKGEVA